MSDSGALRNLHNPACTCTHVQNNLARMRCHLLQKFRGQLNDIFIPQFHIFEARLQYSARSWNFRTRPPNLLQTSKYCTRAWNIGTPGRIPEPALEGSNSSEQAAGSRTPENCSCSRKGTSCLTSAACIFLHWVCLCLFGELVTQTYYS